MNDTPCPWSWPLVLLIAACLFVLAVDTSSLEGVPGSVWSVMYLVAGVGFVWWRATMRRWFLLVSMGALFLACWSRATVFLIGQPDRAAGIALNVLVAIMAALTMRSQLRCST